MRVYMVVRSLVVVAATASLTLSAGLSAQALTTDIGIRSIGTPQVTLADRIDAALALPLRTVEMREVGIPNKAIRRVLDEMQVRNLPTSEQLDILATETDAVREGKPHADFGAFVQGRLDAGERGAALAQAIQAERRRRTPDSAVIQEIAFADVPPAVSQLPDPAHVRRNGSTRPHAWTWGKRP